MLHVAIITLALTSGECPECDRGGWGVLTAPRARYRQGAPQAPALVPPPPIIRHPSLLQVIPCPVVRCVGQNCFSTTRPYLPGVPVFDYRQEFDYPWSQAPSALRPVAVGGYEEYELIDEPKVVPTPAGASRGTRTRPSKYARRAHVVVASDQGDRR
jgi:hypothetical protein